MSRGWGGCVQKGVGMSEGGWVCPGDGVATRLMDMGCMVSTHPCY